MLDVNPVGPLSRGDAIAVTYSSGPELVTVPGGLMDTQASAASQAIVAAGLVPNRVTQPGSQPAGTVISVNPSEGSSVPRGSTVTIVVSNGPAPSASADSESTQPDGP